MTKRTGTAEGGIADHTDRIVTKDHTENGKTILFEERFGVSIDDFDDIMAVDRFIESKIGRPLEVTDRRTSFTMRGGNVFKVSDRPRESLERSINASMDAVRAQRLRIGTELQRMLTHILEH